MKLSRSTLFEIAKYTMGCGLGLLLKTGLNAFFTHFELALWCSYLIVQFIILVSSFLYHFKFTFGRSFDSLKNVWQSFQIYVPSVIVFKALDYLLVICFAEYLKSVLQTRTNISIESQQIINTVSILFVSCLIFAIRYFVYKNIFHKRTQAELDYYTGPVKNVYTGYSSTQEIASNAASGGFISTMLIGLLKENAIQGALISRFEFKNGKPVASGYIATTPAEITASQGSIYMSFPLLSKQTMEAIRVFDGKLAIVALPCQCNALRKIMERDSAIREKISLVIGLFCGHTSKQDLLVRVLKKKKIAMEKLENYRFRRGLGRGMAVATMKDGLEKTWPTAFFNLYQNLFIESAPQCLSCFDHFAENADVSCGDIWTWEHRKDTIKHSVFCSRTSIGDEYLRKVIDDGALVVTPLTQEQLLKSNIRAAIYHKAIKARAEIATKYNITINVPVQAKPSRWNERLAAKIVFRFQTMPPEKALSMNRRHLKFWLYIFKGLTNF